MSAPRLPVLFLAFASFGAAGCESCKDDRPATPPAAEAAPAPTREAGALVNETTVPTASVAKVVNPFDATPYAGPTGSLEGTVTHEGDPPPAQEVDLSKCPAGQATYGKLFRVGAAAALADAIVAVQAFPDQFVPEKNEAKTVHIVDCMYDTRTVTLTFGQRLEVKNDGDELLIPGLEPLLSPAMMVAPPHADPVKLYPPKPGRYRLVERSGRSYMTAHVFVSPHPMHATTDLSGHYRIDGVPAGKRQVQAHHPEIGDGPRATVKTVDVVPNVVTKLDFVVRYATPPADAGAPPTAPAADAGKRATLK